MNPVRNFITPLRVTILGVRLIALLLLANCIYYLGSILFSLVAGSRGPGLSAAGPYAAMLLAYLAAVCVLLWYSAPIARSLSRNLPGFVAPSRWSRVELLAAIIAGVAAWEFLAGIPMFFERLFSILAHYLDYNVGDMTERDRFNVIVFGFIGASLRIGVSAIVFLKSGRLAMFWDRRQSAEGLRSGRGIPGRVGL